MSIFLENLLIGYHYSLLENPFSIHIQTSEMIVLYGNNGCGKTTLLKTIARLCKPLKGDIKYNHQSIFDISRQTFPKYFAFLFTTKPFLMNHTLFDIVALGCSPYLAWNGQLTQANKEIIHYYSKLLGIEDILFQQADTVSDGQLQKALIAKTLVQQTPVIILDEPLSYLDHSSKKIILKVLKNIAKQENKIILLSSHDIHLSQKVADKILLIHQKQWIYDSFEKVSSHQLFNDFFELKI